MSPSRSSRMATKGSLYTICLVNVLIATINAQTEFCESAAVFTYGNCTEECQALDSTNFSDAFFNCSLLTQFGCRMHPCSDGPFSFSCQLERDLVLDRICTGDKIVIDGLDVARNQTLKYFVDLNAPPAEADIYIVIDATGSMMPAIDVAKSKLLDIVDNSFPKNTDTRFGVGYYRDETSPDTSNGFVNALSLTNDRSQIDAAIQALIARRGGDGAEANLVALYSVATSETIGWRENARKIVIYFGDQPGHEPTCVAGLPRLDREVVANALATRNITVVAVSFNGNRSSSDIIGLNAVPSVFGCGGPPGASGQLNAIIDGTNGSAIEESDQKNLIEGIQKALDSLDRQFDVDESECTGKIASSYTPTLPLFVKAGFRTTVEHSIRILPGVCRTASRFTCRYRYFESGAELPPTTVQFLNIKGCVGL